MPAWKPKGNGTFDNNGVSIDPVASSRGGAINFDPSNRKLKHIPWDDGTNDYVEIESIIPDGVTVGSAVETATGWEYPCTGSLTKIEVVDLQLTNGSPYAEFASEGVKTLFWMPIASLITDQDGKIRPKRLTYSGTHAFNLCEQADVDGTEYFPGHPERGLISQPIWARESIAIYSATKANHRVGGTNYMAGKYGQQLRPTMWGWTADGQYVGRIFGALKVELASQNKKSYTVAKVYDGATVQAWFAANPTITQVSVDAILGYQTIGSSIFDYGQYPSNVAHWKGAMPEDGTISKVSTYTNITGLSGIADIGVYKSTTVPLANGSNVALVVNKGSSFGIPSGGAGWVDATLSGNLTTADDVWVALMYSASGQDMYYDDGVPPPPATPYYDEIVGGSAGACPDPIGSLTRVRLGRSESSYITYSTGPADETDPTIRVTTEAPSTLSANCTVTGTAADNVGVSLVTWTHSGNVTGNCTGTTAWSAAITGLPLGDTTVTFTATDAAANDATATASVRRHPALGANQIWNGSVGSSFSKFLN